MPEPRDPKLFLQDILDSASDISAFIRGMDFDKFMADKRTRLAVTRGLEVIGEAVKNLPEGLRARHPEVNWHQAMAMRDRLIHAYFGASYRIIWDTAAHDLPRMEQQVKSILEELEMEP